jgi:multidrug efflux pump subunit AcrA (membrane-fusion protein)
MSDLPARASAFWRELPPVPRLLIGTVALIVLLTLFKPSVPQKPATDSSPRVLTEIARPGLFSPQLSLFGRIESPASATLSSSVTALVQKAVALPGDRVSRDDLILQLDPREAALARAQADAALSQAEAQKASAGKRHQSDRKALELEQQLTRLAQESVGRLERLRETNLASQTQLDDARQESGPATTQPGNPAAGRGQLSERRTPSRQRYRTRPGRPRSGRPGSRPQSGAGAVRRPYHLPACGRRRTGPAWRSG